MSRTISRSSPLWFPNAQVFASLRDFLKNLKQGCENTWALMLTCKPMFKRADRRKEDFSRLRVLEIVVVHEGFEAFKGSASVIVSHFKSLIVGLGINMRLI